MTPRLLYLVEWREGDAQADADERADAPRVPLDFAHYLLSEYAEEKDNA